MARNNEFQAVIPVRGKILNTQKATIAQNTKKSREINDNDRCFWFIYRYKNYESNLW